MSTIKRSTIVLCINNASVKQWKEQFLQWTNVSDDSVKLFTSGDKNKLPESLNEACIVISTYSMMCHSGKRSESGNPEHINQPQCRMYRVYESHMLDFNGQ